MTYNFDDEQSIEINKDNPSFEKVRDEWYNFIRYGWNIKYPNNRCEVILIMDDILDSNKVKITANIRLAEDRKEV